ncbi:MAG: hypothetical protein ACLT1X_01555 [Christensenellales bacterium]
MKKVVSVLLAAGIIAATGAFAENVGVSSPAACACGVSRGGCCQQHH